jgi:hypothetical protein
VDAPAAKIAIPRPAPNRPVAAVDFQAPVKSVAGGSFSGVRRYHRARRVVSKPANSRTFGPDHPRAPLSGFMNAFQLDTIRQQPDAFFARFYRQAGIDVSDVHLRETRQLIINWTDDELRDFLREVAQGYQLPAELPAQIVADLSGATRLYVPPAPEPAEVPPEAADPAAPDGAEVPEPTANVREETPRPPDPEPAAPEVPPVPVPAAAPVFVAPPVPPREVPTERGVPPVSSVGSGSRPRRRLGAGTAGVGVALLVMAAIWWLGRRPGGTPYVAITNAIVRERPEARSAQAGTVERAQTLTATGKRAGRWVEIYLDGGGLLGFGGAEAWVDSQFVMRRPDYELLNRVLPSGAGTGLTSQHYWALRRYAAPRGTDERYRLELLPAEAREAKLLRYLTANFTGRAFQDSNLRRNRSKNRNLIVLLTDRESGEGRLVIFEFDTATKRYGQPVYEETVEPELALRTEPGGFALCDYAGNTRRTYRYENGQVQSREADVLRLLTDDEADGEEEEP